MLLSSFQQIWDMISLCGILVGILIFSSLTVQYISSPKLGRSDWMFSFFSSVINSIVLVSSFHDIVVLPLVEYYQLGK